MDIVKTKQKSSFIAGMLSAKPLLYFILFALIIIIFNLLRTEFHRVELAKHNLLIGAVERGDLDVTVAGYGKLVSDKLQLVTSLTGATVSEIKLKPGAQVKEGSVIAILTNPQLQQALEYAEQELSLAQANLRQLAVNHQRELLNEEAHLAELTALYESAKIKKNAEQTLVKDGIVSELTYKESQLHTAQLQQRIVLLTKRTKQLAYVHSEAMNIAKEHIKQKQGSVQIALHRLASLHVKAKISGVLQRLSIQLGQSVAAGQELALIGSTSELIALIRVPQSQAMKVKIGQPVAIDTRQQMISGEVTRIDPIVADNTVEVEIGFVDAVPIDARPEQNINGTITVKTLHDTLYLKRPANVQANSDMTLYKVNEESSLATRTSVSFGEKTNQYVQLITPVAIGERYIISDLTNYKATEITLN